MLNCLACNKQIRKEVCMGLFDAIKEQAEEMTGMDLDGLMDKLPENLGDIFDSEFMKENTSLDSIQSLLSLGGFKADKLTDIEGLPMDALNKLIGEKTNFGNWQEMLQKAAAKFM